MKHRSHYLGLATSNAMVARQVHYTERHFNAKPSAQGITPASKAPMSVYELCGRVRKPSQNLLSRVYQQVTAELDSEHRFIPRADIVKERISALRISEAEVKHWLNSAGELKQVRVNGKWIDISHEDSPEHNHLDMRASEYWRECAADEYGDIARQPILEGLEVGTVEYYIWALKQQFANFREYREAIRNASAEAINHERQLDRLTRLQSEIVQISEGNYKIYNCQL